MKLFDSIKFKIYRWLYENINEIGKIFYDKSWRILQKYDKRKIK